MRATLEYLSMGAAVEELQTKLNILLPAFLPPLKVGGIFGDKTLARVATVDDCRTNVNIPPFGKCKSDRHPAYSQLSNPWEGTGMDLVF